LARHSSVQPVRICIPKTHRPTKSTQTGRSLCPSISSVRFASQMSPCVTASKSISTQSKPFQSGPPPTPRANLRNPIALTHGHRTHLSRKERPWPALAVCGCAPMTGFYRTGCCETGRRRPRRPHHLLRGRPRLPRRLKNPWQRPLHPHARVWLPRPQTRRPLVRLRRPLATGAAGRSRLRRRPRSHPRGHPQDCPFRSPHPVRRHPPTSSTSLSAPATPRQQSPRPPLPAPAHQ